MLTTLPECVTIDAMVKTCNKCDEQLPTSEFGKRTDTGGLRSTCRSCDNKTKQLRRRNNPGTYRAELDRQNARRRQRRADDPEYRERINARNRKPVNPDDILPEGHKRCSKCREVKAFCEFYKNRAQVDGYDNYCKSCSKAYKSTPEYLKHRANYDANYKRTPTGSASRSRYNNSPKGKAQRANAATRRIQANGYPQRRSDWSHKDLEFRYLYQAGRCLGCYTPYALKDLECDHNLPQSRKGQNTYDNLLLLCRSCNASKNNRTFAEWFDWRYNLCPK